MRPDTARLLEAATATCRDCNVSEAKATVAFQSPARESSLPAAPVREETGTMPAERSREPEK